MAKLTDTEVLSLLSKFEAEWGQFRGLWDQLTPSFHHLKAVVTRCNELSQELPSLEAKHAKMVASVKDSAKERDEGRRVISEQLIQHRENMERELAPLTKVLNDTREKVLAIQGARADAEKSFEERRFAQEATLKELEDRLAEAKRRLYDIGQLAGAANAG
jgi:chromosome segregation ATPase